MHFRSSSHYIGLALMKLESNQQRARMMIDAGIEVTRSIRAKRNDAFTFFLSFVTNDEIFIASLYTDE